MTAILSACSADYSSFAYLSVQTTAHMYVCLCVQMTALPDRDVVFVRFQNEGTSHSCLPYFIAIDEHSNSVGQLRHAQTDMAAQQHNSNMSVVLLLLLLLWSHSCVLLRHMCMYSAHAQTDKLSVICTDRHGCNSNMFFFCCSSSCANIARTLPDGIVFSWFFCFSVSFLCCFHIHQKLKRPRQSLGTLQASACQHA